MAGTLQIHEMTGTSTGSDKTSDTVRFKSADETSVDASSRLQIPAADTAFSYTKLLRAYVSVAPDTDFSNLEVYTDGGTFANSVTCQYDVIENFSSGNTDADISGTDIFTKTAGAKEDMNSWKATHTVGEGTTYWGSFLRLQLEVDNTATPGTLTAETLTFSYDET